MTAPGGFIDFFAMEATEYIEQLDGLLLRARDSVPDGEAMQRTARALRGAATMARLPAFAELAAAVEGIGRATRDGVLEWNAALRGAMTSAVDELKILVRAVRSWGDTENRRAAARASELAAFAPAPRRTTPVVATGAAPSFLVSETANIAAGLELVLARPDNAGSVSAVLSRVRALRGVAGLKDLPPLPEVAEAAENAAHPLELGQASLSTENVELLQAASALLRRIAAALRDGRAASEPSPEYDRFVAAADAAENTGTESARIVPIASLFYNDDGPHVVSAAPNPPTTPRQRFRMEAVSLAEHLRGVVASIRATQDPQVRERARRDLRRVLRNIRQTAESFGEESVAGLVAAHANVADRVDDQALETVDRIVQAIAQPDALPAEMSHTPSAHTPAAPAPTPATARTPAPAPAAVATPTPAMASTSPLDQGIAALDAFSAQPFAKPTPVDVPVVPIDALLYHGRAAVERAVQIRDQIRSLGGPPSPDLLSELFDLLDLALAE
ncbi:MAG TPA: Hpt domain-containing protein [Gemmatimonadaceae bacterium]|nr:Hpt domain-containing protein [Gemmatimonadaceae bacterium]